MTIMSTFWQSYPYLPNPKEPPTFTDGKKKQKWWGKNCLILADFLSTKPVTAHNQAQWCGFVDSARKNAPPCGTVACAMGWAALSKKFRGLRTGYYLCGMYSHVFPTKKEVALLGFSEIESVSTIVFVGQDQRDYPEAGRMYFGPVVTKLIFLRTGASLDCVIARLRAAGNALINGDSSTKVKAAIISVPYVKRRLNP